MSLFLTHEPLFKIKNGKEEAMPVPYNKENTLKFRKALQIWTLKPQVVDRRILCATVLQRDVMPREELSDSTTRDVLLRLTRILLSQKVTVAELEPEKRSQHFMHRIKDFPGKFEEADVFGDTHRPRPTITCFEEETSDFTLRSEVKPELEGTEVAVVLIKILPRQSDRMKPFHQIVLTDYPRNEAFFIRLDSGPVQPRIPEDLNQSWSYKISWDEHSQKISITTSEYYEHHHPVKALPELTPPTKDWLFSPLLPKLCKWTKEINPELQLLIKKSVISMERYSKVHALLKIKYAEKFVKMWTESTDPQKYVYEDISIAAYLIVLWEEERERKNLVKKQSFVDLGCGNGLLVHILISEGVSAHSTLLKNSAGQNSAFPT